jgi:hypothetical protein
VGKQSPAQQAAVKRWYDNNRGKALDNAEAWNRRNPEKRRSTKREYLRRLRAAGLDSGTIDRAWLSALKIERGCEFVHEDGTVCGFREHAAALEFDHRDPRDKGFNVSRAVGRRSRAALLVEVAKCDVLCANHHRIRTATQGHYTMWRDEVATSTPNDPQLSLFEEAS